MTIQITSSGKAKAFHEINHGDVFVHQGIWCMKVTTSHLDHAYVELFSGKVYPIPSYQKVGLPEEAVLTIKKD